MASFTNLSTDETELLHRVGSGPASRWAPRSTPDHPANDLASQRYLISGWAACERELSGGRRQIVQLVLPGEPLVPQIHVRDHMQVVRCLTMVHTVDGAAIGRAARDPAKFPGIAAATELAAAHDRALLMDQVLRIGRQTAYERMANMFLELHYRCGTIGLLHADGFPFPLTQDSIADLVGLSVVHVNRTLQMMRREGLISLQQGRLTLLNIPVLSETAEFTPPKLSYFGSE